MRSRAPRNQLQRGARPSGVYRGTLDRPVCPIRACFAPARAEAILGPRRTVRCGEDHGHHARSPVERGLERSADWNLSYDAILRPARISDFAMLRARLIELANERLNFSTRRVRWELMFDVTG